MSNSVLRPRLSKKGATGRIRVVIADRDERLRVCLRPDGILEIGPGYLCHYVLGETRADGLRHAQCYAQYRDGRTGLLSVWTDRRRAPAGDAWVGAAGIEALRKLLESQPARPATLVVKSPAVVWEVAR
ncbi:MAG: hypothetical protein L0332_34505 [Chloroflexi bacterium]|nr:hypothetical protein [Chloroflexota bacterium]